MYYTKKEKKERNLQAWYDERSYRLERLEEGCETPGRSLLDSSLISTTNKKTYTHKIIQCGNYYQIYNYHEKRIKKDKDMEKMKTNIVTVNTDYLVKKENINKPRSIELKNILRSKFQLQRLVKSNEDIFNTFITLTFADNIRDISKANECFKNWRDTLSKYLRKQKKEFSYVCVPEFQKRGAVHYHLKE